MVLHKGAPLFSAKGCVYYPKNKKKFAIDKKMMSLILCQILFHCYEKQWWTLSHRCKFAPWCFPNTFAHDCLCIQRLGNYRQLSNIYNIDIKFLFCINIWITNAIQFWSSSLADFGQSNKADMIDLVFWPSNFIISK